MSKSSGAKLSEEEYKNLKKQLNSRELKEIEELEKDCEDLSINYFEFERKAGSWMIGGWWTAEALRAAFAKPITKLKAHLIYRAGELRNIKFSE
jgi:hypothetical protein